MKAHLLYTLFSLVGLFAVVPMNVSAQWNNCYNDTEPPVAVCIQYTVVSLSSNGTAKVYASTFDNGSYDNCEIKEFKAARMSPGWCPYGVVDDTQFRPYVEFCCEDIGHPVMIIMKVIDKKGNSNTCMVEVSVQDKLPPSIHCPYDKVIWCDDWYPEHELYDPYSPYFGSPTVSDNCGLEYVDVHVVSNTSCKVGKIKRIFTAVDWGGATASCIQHIHIKNKNPFNKYDIKWPKDYKTDGCDYVGTDPDHLPPGFDRPTYYNTKCSMVGVAYEDLVFEFVEGVCKKILRTWTVIDWCQFDPHDPWSKGIWTHVQVIKLSDHYAPQFEACKDTVIAGQENTCAGKVILDPQVWDICTPKDKLGYEYKIDLYKNGTIDIKRTGRKLVNEVLPVGVHKVLWFVDDGCGNTGTCSFHVEVIDGKAPTPVCFAQLSTAVMPAGGMVTLWAKDFDASSFDNCTPVNKLKFHFDKNTPYVGSKTFNCDYIGTNQIQVYVTDQAGNQAFCNVMLQIADNEGVCPAMNPLSGAVMSYSGVAVADADVALYKVMPDSSMLMDREDHTNLGGQYQTGFGTTSYDRMLEVVKDDDPLEGISTLDIILVQQHILGIQEITDPHALFAADVDGSGDVGIADLIMLRDAFLSNGRSLLDNTLPWFFYPTDCPVDMALDGECSKMVEIDQHDPPSDPINFIGVKKGDINGDIKTELTGRAATDLTVTLHVTSEGGTVIRAVAENDIDASGLQFSMFTNIFQSGDIPAVEDGKLRIGSENVRFNDEDGTLNVSWVPSKSRTIRAGEVLFTIDAGAADPSELLQSVIFSADFQDQVYTSVLQAMPMYFQWGKVQLVTEGAPSTGTAFDSGTGLAGSEGAIVLREGAETNAGIGADKAFADLRIWPNPTSGDTYVSFVSEIADSEARIELFSPELRLMDVTEIDVFEGQNQLLVGKDRFGAPGIYYIRVVSEGTTEVRKVIFTR